MRIDMAARYFIVYNPLTYNLMDLFPANSLSPLDVISYLTGKNAREMTSENCLAFVDFQVEKQRTTMVDALAIEMYTGLYIQTQLAKLAKDYFIVMIDGRRKKFSDVIREKRIYPPRFLFLP